MPLLPLFLIIFIGVPLAEIYLLIEVGGAIGAIPTVLAVVSTAVLGVSLIRIQGFSTLQKAQASMSQGVLPATEMLEGLMLLFAALCLLIPGFFTDAVGFLLLVPPLRKLIATYFVTSAVMKSRFNTTNRGQGDYFEGEYEDLTPEQQHARNQAHLQQQRIIEGTIEKTMEESDQTKK